MPYKQTAWGESVAEAILYCLWDMGLKVGHATRSIDECIRQAKADMTIRTAILEARYLLGDRGLYDDRGAEGNRTVTPLLADAAIPDAHDYFARWGLTRARLKLARPEAIVMHPGPMNREIEIATDVADGPQSVIRQQVTNGVAVRMAVLEQVIANRNLRDQLK